jgi:hypothetical protein
VCVAMRDSLGSQNGTGLNYASWAPLRCHREVQIEPAFRPVSRVWRSGRPGRKVPACGLAHPGLRYGAIRAPHGFNAVVHAADARAVPEVRPERAGGWRRKATFPLMSLVLVAAALTWLQVVKTIRDPDPLSIPERPQIAGIVWSNRVFIHERALERWFETRGRSYAAWARNHPRAAAVLRGKPLPPRAAPAANKPRLASRTERSNDAGLARLILLAAGALGATALLVPLGRRAVVDIRDHPPRLPRLPRLHVPDVGPRAHAARRGSARTGQAASKAAPRAGSLTRGDVHALSEGAAKPLSARLGSRWASAHSSWRARERRKLEVRQRIAGTDGVGSSRAGDLRYWVLVTVLVLAATGVTFLISLAALL